ncbi:universal stress protein [uncultured Chitinophaga sp.]|uniref:universal stress protein n=1 Tax=uncultured Chitinophaga sp. TaxID=339340 RepID=UPI0025F87F63|nr:universal stress protein [uncultured Chitinophaga sp.]
MKKILFVADAATQNAHRLDFACYVSKLTHSTLTGIFLSSEHDAILAEETTVAVTANEHPYTRQANQRTITTEKAVLDFKRACESREANCTVQLDTDVPVRALIRASRYADLIIADPGLSFTGKQENAPSDFLRSVMSGAECPVITAPFEFEGVDEIVFTFDGSSSSVYAMRQFTYLFPELCELQVTAVCVTAPDEPAGGHISDLKEWLNIHYSHVQFLHLEDSRVNNRLLEYLIGKKRSLIVMGAFGRNTISGTLFPSHAIPVLQFADQPVFIAHK